MTNQNNELDRILKDLQVKSFNAGTLGSDRKYGKNRAEAKQAIQALYAPKPVENGELRETILSILGIVDRTSGNRPEQIATLEQELTAHTNAEIAKVLDRLESNKKIYVKHAEYVTELNETPLVITTDYKYMLDLDAIQAERAKLKEVV